jgi:hypothetical protein
VEDKRTPIIAGLGGVALAAAMFTGGGRSAVDTKANPPTKIESSSLSEVQATTNDNGPWYAFCREYTTTGFDHGTDPSDEPGTKSHRVPREAQDGTTEITRPYGHEKEKFKVKNHVVGYLPTCVPPGNTLRIMIATVPDPAMTQMGLDFDRDIEAIQAAAAAAGYTYTRYWFPWRQPGWVADKSADPDEEVHRRDEPGILCFRKHNNSANIASGGRLFVFLVGETPTSGVNRLQLAHALYYWQQLRRKDIEGTDQDRIGISGPHFSASLPALEDVLNEAVYKNIQPGQTPPTLDFVSPDVSGPGFIYDFSTYCNLQVPLSGAPPCTLQTLSLQANEADLIALNYLRSLGYDGHRIAFLEEDESAFSVGENSSERQDAGLGLFHFPRDLSSLRSLSDLESQQIAEAGSKYLSLSQGSPIAPLSALQPTERDTPEPYATKQEPAEAARVLADDVGQMRAARIEAVVIVATNPLDRSYLLEYLRQQLPDARTATIDADELELGSPQFIDLTGTIAVTSMPPLLNLLAGDNSGRRLSFRSSRQQGEFLAVQALLDPNSGTTIGNASGEEKTPCYAISVVGENGFHPVPDDNSKGDSEDPRFPCFVTASSGEKTTPSAVNRVEENAEAPTSFLAFLFIVALFNLAHLWSCINSLRAIEGLFSYPRLLKGPLESRRLNLLFVLNNQLFLLNLLAWRAAHALWRLPFRSGSHGLWFALLYYSVFDLLIASLALSLLFLVGFMMLPSKGEGANVGQFVTGALYLGTSGLMIWFLPALAVHLPVLLERVTLLGEGLSPLLPIAVILAAYFLWGSMQLRRLDWIYSRRIYLGDLTSNIPLNRRLYEVMTQAEAMTPKGKFVLGASALGLLGGRLLWNSLSGFDGYYFHLWFVVWGFGGLLVTVILAACQAWSIWDGLRKLLEWLEATPIREAFQKLGDDGVVKINIWDFTNQRRSFTVLDATVESMRCVPGNWSPQADQARAGLDDFIAADSEKSQVIPTAIDTLHAAMNAPMVVALQSLDAGVVAGSVPELHLYLALRLVAFIRYATLQIMTLIGFVASGYFLAALSVMFYPFAGRKTLAELLALTFVGILALLGLMMVQFGKNDMLSRLEGSTPGEVSYGRVALRLLTTGGLPLLAVATALFPALGQFVFSFLRPVLGAFH